MIFRERRARFGLRERGEASGFVLEFVQVLDYAGDAAAGDELALGRHQVDNVYLKECARPDGGQGKMLV